MRGKAYSLVYNLLGAAESLPSEY